MRATAWIGTRAALAVACVTWAHLAAAQTTAAGSPSNEVYSADVVIDDSIVDAHGAVVEARPSTRYHLARRRVAGGVETEIAYASGKLFAKGPLVDPRGGTRIVFGVEGTARLYDAAGTLVQTIDAPAPPGADAEAALVYADRDLRRRGEALRHRMGRSTGRVGRHDRYVSSEGDATTETLVEPGTMLPVEVNVVRDGALAERSMLDYARMPGGRWYLARTRHEKAVADGTGRRFVSTTTHTNVRGSEGR